MLGCTALAFLGQSLVHTVVSMPALLWPLLVALGGLMGGLYTMSLALIGERFRGPDLTDANTAFVLTFQLGTIIGPPYAGAVMQATAVGIFPFTLLLPLLALGAGLVPGPRRS